MMKRHFNRFLWVSLLWATWLMFPALSASQVEDVQRPAGQQQDPAAKENQAEPGTEEEPSVEVRPANQPPVNPKELRLHLWDGSVITGELSVDGITVETEFGTLQVPVEKVVAFHPGLQSYPKIRQRIEMLVQQLGADDFNARKEAHQLLSQMGLQLQHQIGQFDDGGNAERKKHLEEIKQEISQLADEIAEFGETPQVRPFIQGDAVQTPDFTIVGKIKQDQFEISSKYGLLTVQLADVRMCDRQQGPAQEVQRQVVVSGNDFIQSNAKSTGIRVQQGDKISIRAEGQIVMSPWGSNRMSTPDGSPQFGSYEGLPGGALTAVIGEGKVFKVGAKHEFTARQAGILKLGIAMQQDYAQGNYVFPGQYRARITVTSAADSQ